VTAVTAGSRPLAYIAAMGSPPMIPDPATPIAAVAARSIAWLEVLERHGLEYCCRGTRSLLEACRECGADPEEVIHDLRSATVEFLTKSGDWTLAPLGDLLSYIAEVHHAAVRQALPELIRECESRHPEAAVELGALLQDLEPHLRAEEELIFPAIRRLADGVPPLPSLEETLRWRRKIEEEHAGIAFRVRSLARIAAHGPLRHSEWTARLDRTLRQLRLHLHMEGNILLPRAVAGASAAQQKASKC
jgi:regulator of cell morphogenesis and NO signaling